MPACQRERFFVSMDCPQGQGTLVERELMRRVAESCFRSVNELHRLDPLTSVKAIAHETRDNQGGTAILIRPCH